MEIVYSSHAMKRMKQRGISELEVEHILEHPFYIKKTIEGLKEAVGTVQSRTVKVIYDETENYINIVTVM